MSGDVLCRTEDAAAIVSLNRPAAIHALNLNMVHAMTGALVAWRDDAAVEAIIIDHALSPDGDPKKSRGFCAGGDIAFLRNSALTDGGVSGRAFFYDEYRLNHLLFTYSKPVVAFMDGITMGGGVGIALPARYRVATENTRLAMPETGIGLFPDVGGGWYLSRLPGHVGEYLALTGARVNGAECLALGLATHYLSADTLAKAKRRIADAPSAIAATLDALSIAAPAPAILDHRAAIDRHFAGPELEDILASLAADNSEWAQSTLATLRSKSPQTCKVALRQLRASRALPDFAANMAMEYRIAARVLTRPDFAEGVRAVIVDKDHRPQWNPATPEEVTTALLDDIFAPLPAEQEWTPL
ncbi:MAG: enoyl-CoA hydratase/isomerase family protein [Sphingopyxis sp.]|nr:enoyl-CoA hydratase/isomerase family protein [Sphingopyxis sp.]